VRRPSSTTAGTWHVPETLLDRFAAIDEASLPGPVLWSVEAHLERCPDCRARLTRTMAARSPETLALVESTHSELAARIAALPPAARPSRRGLTQRLTGGMLVSRLAACVAVLLVAALLDLAADTAAGAPSWVLLAAPVLPLLGVAASWSRALDPAHELVAATPARGLRLLLRRTLVVLVLVVPASLLADALVGTGGEAAWLLPCLALTASGLALGSFVDMGRATIAVAAAWGVGVVAPALASNEAPELLEGAWLPAWAALTILAAGVIAMRRHAYRRLIGA
jgi:hypothetical protein